MKYFKFSCTKTPIPLASFLVSLPNNEQYINRHTPVIFTQLSKPNIDTLRDSFIFYVLQEFKKLPYRIKNITSIHNFKISLHNHLFHNDQS